MEGHALAEIRRRQVAEFLNTITHERHVANGYEEIEYNPASGTERALDTISKRTRYPDDAHAKRPGEFNRLWSV